MRNIPMIFSLVLPSFVILRESDMIITRIISEFIKLSPQRQHLQFFLSSVNFYYDIVCPDVLVLNCNGEGFRFFFKCPLCSPVHDFSTAVFSICHIRFLFSYFLSFCIFHLNQILSLFYTSSP